MLERLSIASGTLKPLLAYHPLTHDLQFSDLFLFSYFYIVHNFARNHALTVLQDSWQKSQTVVQPMSLEDGLEDGAHILWNSERAIQYCT